jgi:preprotein translocase subunit SecF
VFKAAGLEMKAWTAEEQQQYTHADEGTGEFNEVFSIWGLDKQYRDILEKGISTSDSSIEAIVDKSYGVGAKAGDQLRNDAAKSIIYAIFLIMLYLAFRFDIRYAPGAAFATIHDAVMVIGVFAVTWTEVSLTSVAGLLTVMGYSVNDTVIVFDRIRENQAKLKDKKVERIIDISINEMLVRTILTSSTVFATTLIMNIFGTGLVKNFAFAMNIGVIVGTYSSIFLAAPIFMYISRRWYSGPPPKRRVAAAVSIPSASSSDDGDDE